jgi:hypothetical protein
VILAAGLLVLLGLGLFVAAILTGVTVLYWACVAACVVAAVVLIAVRRKSAATPAATPAVAPAAPVEPVAGTVPEDDTGAATPAGTETETQTGAAEGGANDQAPVTATARRESGATRSGSAAPAPEAAVAVAQEDPGVEEVEVTDLLLVVDLTDEVLVVDEHPRYHVADCSWLAGRETIPLPVDEARADEFTPCAVCSPDHTLAERARVRKQAAGS